MRDDSGHLKVADFGLSKLMKVTKTIKEDKPTCFQQTSCKFPVDWDLLQFVEIYFINSRHRAALLPDALFTILIVSVAIIYVLFIHSNNLFKFLKNHNSNT